MCTSEMVGVSRIGVFCGREWIDQFGIRTAQYHIVHANMLVFLAPLMKQTNRRS